jgi:type II secretory pathway pseudopilin PulG
MNSARMAHGFTLIEMIVATIAATLLVAGVLLMTSALSRDRAQMNVSQTSAGHRLLIDHIEHDLTNSTTFTQLNNGHALILTGHAGIDPSTLAVNGRLARVIYEIRGAGSTAALFRHQKYLDEPARAEDWTELVSLSTTALYLIPVGNDFEAVERPVQPPKRSSSNADDPPEPPARRVPKQYWIPAHARIHVQRQANSIDEELWLR